MVAAPSQQVYDAIHPTATKYNVPDPIWETVAYMESGYNPNAVGDQGTSFGIFQLHQGGALRSSPSAVMGTGGIPENALEAMPRIAGAWSNLKSSFDPGSLDWWTSFAAQSGHPGGGPGNVATQHAAQAMLNDYTGTLGSNQTNTDATSTGTNTCPGWCALVPAWGPCANCDTTAQAYKDFGTAAKGIVDPAVWARIGVIILGGILIIFGAMKLLK